MRIEYLSEIYFLKGMKNMGDNAKRKIEETFVELIKTRDLDKITVKDISDNAYVARRTFYHCYCDIPDLMEGILKRYMRELIEKSTAMSTPSDIVNIFVEEMERNFWLLSKVLKSKYRLGAELVILDAVRKLVAAIGQSRHSESELPEDKSEFLVDVTACMVFTYLMEHSYKKDMTNEEISQQFIWLFDNLSHIFESVN